MHVTIKPKIRVRRGGAKTAIKIELFQKAKREESLQKLQGLPKRYADKKVPQKTSENDSEKRRAEKKVGKNSSSLNETP